MHGRREYVCANCFEDPGLIRFIEANAVADECSFCDATGDGVTSALIDDVSKHFMKCISREYDLADNQLGWVGSEGGYIGPHWDGFDLATDELQMEFPRGNEWALLQELFGQDYDQHWCPENAYGYDDLDRPKYSWEYFKRVVMYERRFFFMDDEGDPDDFHVLSPADVLQTLFEYAGQMRLFKKLPVGSRLIRARREKNGERFQTPEELGPPPRDVAKQANRMSPAGIPMFYGCDEGETCLLEADSGAGYYALGEFVTVRPAVLLDLTEIPEVPGLFDPIPDVPGVIPRRALRFLRHIADEMSSKIVRGDRVHIEYVPTQVVTEFIRSRVTWEGLAVDGIKYISSVHEGHVSYVLFADQSNVVGTGVSGTPEDRWLELVDVQRRWFESPQGQRASVFARCGRIMSRLFFQHMGR